MILLLGMHTSLFMIKGNEVRFSKRYLYSQVHPRQGNNINVHE